MTIAAKICGITSEAALDAAVRGGAEFLGFNFYGPSPRHVTPKEAARLAGRTPASLKKVALTVDANDEDLAQIVETLAPDVLQLHGNETVERVRAVQQRFNLPVMKAVPIGGPDDIQQAKGFETVVDWLLFDAKPPKTMPNALPGGNGLAFDWALIADVDWRGPWMLSGGLTPENVAEAVTVTKAGFVDVSSGVEESRGVKSPDLIEKFLTAVREL
jgi:phosphoribosylanthranilate isomerase